MKKIPAWLLLCIIALVAGLALGFTNELTKDEIARLPKGDKLVKILDKFIK